MGTGKTYSTKYLLDSNNNSGVAGQVLSTTSTGIDWVDANTVPGAGLWLANGNDIYNSNSGNVGIGTTSPSTKLHVAGTTDANIIRVENTSTALSLGDTIGAIQFFNNDTTDDSPNVAASIYATAGASGGSGSLRFKTIEPGVEGDPATEAMIITNGGNVGIGTSNPASLLHIKSTATTPQGITVEGGDESFIKLLTGGVKNWGFITTNLAASDFGIYQSNSNGGDPFTAGTPRLYFDGSGNVGIGTTSPGSPLSVVGSYSSSDEIVEIGGGTGINTDFKLKIGAVDQDYIWFQSVKPGDNYYDLVFNPTAGNVGIGTTNPGYKLDVVGSIKASVQGRFASGSASAPAYSFDSDSDSGIYRVTTNVLGFATAGTERMRIEADGQVSLRTAGAHLMFQNTVGTAPYIANAGTGYADLTIATGGSERMRINSNGQVNISQKPNSGLTYDVLINLGTSPDGLIGYQTQSQLAANLAVNSSSNWVKSGNDIYNTNSANVGIGTTSPSTLISNSSVRNAAASGLSTSLKGLNIEVPAGGNSQGYVASFANTQTASNNYNAGVLIEVGSTDTTTRLLSVESGGTNRLEVRGDGNVGIGTTSPGTFLQLGSYPVSGTYVNNATYPDVPSEHMIHLTAPSTTGYFGGGISFGENAFTAANITAVDAGGGGALHLAFGTGNSSGMTERVRIANNGNVGIGQTGPGQKLVIGNYGSAADGTMRLTALGGQPTAGTIRNSLEFSLSSEFSVNSGDAYKFSIGLNSAVGNQGSYNSDFVIRRTTRLGITDNVDFMIDGTSGNVGIGTTGPGAKLEVVADVAKGVLINRTYTTSSQSLANVRAYYGLAITPLRGGTGGLYFTNYDADTPIIQSVNTSDVAQFLLLNPLGGNVGIGTTNPLGKLMVRDDTAGAPTRLIVSNGGTVQAGTAARLSFYEGTSEKGYIERRRDGSGEIAFVTPADDNPFVWENPTGEIMRINNSNVGIETTSPNSKLQIGFTGSLGAVTTNKKINVTYDGGYSTSNSLQYQVNAHVGTTFSSADIFTQTSGEVLKNFYVGIVSPNSYFNNNRYSIIQGGAERLTILGSISSGAGNVGIGTTSPSQKLHVAGNLRVTGAYYDSNNSAGTSGQVLSSTASGTDWVDVLTGSGTSGVLPKWNSAGTALIDSGLSFPIGSTYADFVLGASGTTTVRFIGNASQTGDFSIKNTTGAIILQPNNVAIGSSVASFSTSSISLNEDTTISGYLRVQGSVQADVYVGGIISPTNTNQGYRISHQGSSGCFIDVRNGTDKITYRDYPNATGTINPMFEMNMSSGNFTATGNIIAFGTLSDKRLKENIKPIDSALDKAMRLQGVTFNWKKSDSILEIGEDIGFIAQDVQKVLPELVRENENGEFSLRHQGITPILLEAIKELKAEIEELKLNKCNCNK